MTIETDVLSGIKLTRIKIQPLMRKSSVAEDSRIVLVCKLMLDNSLCIN